MSRQYSPSSSSSSRQSSRSSHVGHSSHSSRGLHASDALPVRKGNVELPRMHQHSSAVKFFMWAAGGNPHQVLHVRRKETARLDETSRGQKVVIKPQLYFVKRRTSDDDADDADIDSDDSNGYGRRRGRSSSHRPNRGSGVRGRPRDPAAAYGGLPRPPTSNAFSGGGGHGGGHGGAQMRPVPPNAVPHPMARDGARQRFPSQRSEGWSDGFTGGAGGMPSGRHGGMHVGMPNGMPSHPLGYPVHPVSSHAG